MTIAPTFVRRFVRVLVPLVPAAFLTLLLRRLGIHSVRLLWSAFVLTFLITVLYWEKVLWLRRQGLRPFHSWIRYFPVLDILDFWRPYLPNLPSILEVGSGTIGLGNLIEGPFTGCDVRFDGPTPINMRPVIGSASELPFENAQFDLVISVDTLEHIPSRENREKALKNMWRVCRKALIIGYPCGYDAFQADQELAAYYQKRGKAVPDWLIEHLANGLPEEQLLTDILGEETQVTAWRSESTASHLWLMKRDIAPLWGFIFSLLQVAFPAFLRRSIGRWSSSTRSPYRRFYLLRRDAQLPEPSLST